MRWRECTYIWPTRHPFIGLGCGWVLEESDFADDRSELETWLRHLLSGQPRSVYLMFPKLSPIIRLITPSVRVFSEITDVQSVLSLPHRRSSVDVPSFPFCLVLGLDESVGQKSLNQPQAKKGIRERSNEIPRRLSRPGL